MALSYSFNAVDQSIVSTSTAWGGSMTAASDAAIAAPTAECRVEVVAAAEQSSPVAGAATPLTPAAATPSWTAATSAPLSPEAATSS